MKIDNLFDQSLEEIEKNQKIAARLLTARRTLAKLVKFISEAGGAITERELAETTLGELAVIAAQNSFSINFASNRPYLKLPKDITTDVDVDVDCGPYAPGTK
jgi:hypothetical protein